MVEDIEKQISQNNNWEWTIQVQKQETNDSITSNFNTINLARILPCETTDEILESVFDKKESFWEPIDSILNQKFSIEWLLKSLEEEDELTKIIYKKADKDGMILFPQKKRRCKTPPYIWKIWEQTSKYHKETILEHVYMVVAWISKDTENDENMQLIWLLHDIWKKYTTWTNPKWELCFYNHEKVSAYLAATIYRWLWFSKKECEPYVRIIHDHALPYSERTQNEEKKKQYRELYGNYITDCICTLNKNDLWITQEDLSNPQEVEIKRKLMQEWKNILKNLRTEDFQKN